jgi:hypothetical protein
MSLEPADETARRVEARLTEWTAWVQDFGPLHGRIGLFTARHYLGPAAQDEERLFWLALIIGYWVWVDDRSDQRLREQTADWAELVQVLERRRECPRTPVPELDFLLRVERGLAPLARGAEDLEEWRLSAARVLEALRLEEEASRTRRQVAYAEYLEAGRHSIAVLNMLLGTALLLGLRLAQRGATPGLLEVERYFSTVARLENDLVSEQRDRGEGCTANALFVVEPWMGGSAHGFIESELQAFLRLLEQALARLGPEDAWGQLIRRAMAAHAAVYTTLGGGRYAGPPVRPTP